MQTSVENVETKYTGEETKEKENIKEEESTLFPKSEYSDFILTVMEPAKRTKLYLSRFTLNSINSPYIKEWVKDNQDLEVSDFSAGQYEKYFEYAPLRSPRLLEREAFWLLPLAFKFGPESLFTECTNKMPDNAESALMLTKYGLHGRWKYLILF